MKPSLDLRVGEHDFGAEAMLANNQGEPDRLPPGLSSHWNNSHSQEKGLKMKIKPKTKPGGVLVELGPQETQIPAQTVCTAPAIKLQKILVPLDFSDCSKKALQYGITLAKQFGAELILIHVLEPYALVPEAMPYDFEHINDAKEELELLRKFILPPVRARAQLRTGTTDAEIANAAKEFEVDLIVISTHGRKGLSRLVLGGTTEKVVRIAPCPVLIVREVEREFIPGAGTVCESN
jgi:nucleotide-binding universal stress UspA family protein